MSVYFISINYIKLNSPVSQNVDANDLRPHIKPASDMYIQPVLGTNFYDYLVSGYTAQVLSANETTLVEYIQPVVMYYTCVLAMPFLNYQVKNKGSQFQNSDFSTSSENGDKKATSFIMNELENKAQFYLKRLENYLDDNASLFTQYTTNNNDDITPSDVTPYRCGITYYDNGGSCNNINFLY
jgi:hypothetical protein